MIIIEWYRILIVVIGALGLLLALFNWIVHGVDIPNGLVTLLSLIISATLGPDAISKVTTSLVEAKRNNEDAITSIIDTPETPPSVENQEE